MRALVLALAGLGLVVVPVPTHASVTAAQTCQGQTATIVSSEDVVRGTEGDDVILARGSRILSVDGGAGDDVICVRGTVPGDTWELSSVLGGSGHDSVVVRTGKKRDRIQVWTVEELRVSLGGEFDILQLHDALGTGAVDAGAQGGLLKLRFFQKSIRVDLEDETMRLDGAGRFKVSRFSNVIAQAPRVVLDGNSSRNRLLANACRANLQGGRGDDVLIATTLTDATCEPSGRLLGQKGADDLSGTSGHDALLGGPGRDRADGMEGIDRCAAEKERGCER